MDRYVRPILGVLAAIVVTGTLVFETVQFAGSAGAGQVAVSMTCPATGCTSSSCHAAADSNTGTPYASGTSATSGGTLVCPATGCTASTCHATQGGGRGYRGAQGQGRSYF